MCRRAAFSGRSCFCFYVNDLEDHLPPGVELAISADDTTIHTILKPRDSADASCANLQAAVDALSKWRAEWHITFEPTKSQAMTIGRKRSTWDTPPIIFNDNAVKEEDEKKLAVHARQRLGFLRRASKYLHKKGRASV